MPQSNFISPSSIINRQHGKIYFYDNVTSVLDEAFKLASMGNLQIWDSVLANTQSNGRGQLRRHWHSPAGNLYAALKLPENDFYADYNSTPFLGFLCAMALRKFGLSIKLKWPNDLVYFSEYPAKIGGILLEEKANNLIAGIGINLTISPPSHLLRQEASLPSGFIPLNQHIWHFPLNFWNEFLPEFVNLFYKFLPNLHLWHDIYNELLLWRGKTVEIIDGKDTYCGFLEGMDMTGALVLSHRNKKFIVYNGSMKVKDE